MSNIIDFEEERHRRVVAEMEEYGAHQDDIRNQLIEVMVRSKLPDVSLKSVTLRALLDVLEAGDMSRHDAKQSIARTLNVFRE